MQLPPGHTIISQAHVLLRSAEQKTLAACVEPTLWQRLRGEGPSSAERVDLLQQGALEYQTGVNQAREAIPELKANGTAQRTLDALEWLRPEMVLRQFKGHIDSASKGAQVGADPAELLDRVSAARVTTQRALFEIETTVKMRAANKIVKASLDELEDEGLLHVARTADIKAAARRLVDTAVGADRSRP